MATSKKKIRKPKSSRARKRRLARLQKNDLNFQTLEPRQLLAGVVVGNSTDLVNADISSISALIANDGGDGISLREAITASNNTVGLDTITFAGSVFTGGNASLIRLTQGELSVSEELTIDGASATDLIISGDANGNDTTVSGTYITDVSASLTADANSLDDNSRVINLGSDDTLTLTDLTVTGGSVSSTSSSYGGGGIYSFRGGVISLTNSKIIGNSTFGFNQSGGGIAVQDVTLINSAVSDNSTFGEVSGGGGIFASDVTLMNSSVSGNSTTNGASHGGGIDANLGNVTLTNSTVSGNSTADATGGGISHFRGDLTLINSTISDNSAIRSGGISTSDSNTLIVSSTIVGNSAVEAGGGISFHDDEKQLTILNSILAGNTDDGTAPDLLVDTIATNAPFVEHTLIGNTTGSGITAATGSGNILNQPALLGPLADNGGPTQTHALLTDSPAIDAGSNGWLGGLTTDQRGNDRIEFGTVDIGAFESPFEGGSFVVTTNEDIVDATDFETSLREAINYANSNIGSDTITFGSAFTGGAASLIRLTQGELSVSESLTIDGSSATNLVITGDSSSNDVTVAGTNITDVAASLAGNSSSLTDNSRVLNFGNTSGDLTLKNLTVTGGRTYFNGGGINADSGNVILNNSKVIGNHGAGYYIYSPGPIGYGDGSAGGGIYTGAGNVTLNNSVVSDNSTAASLGNEANGGGIATSSGNVALNNSTVSGNSTALVSSPGGGISTDTGDVSLVNSTVSGNSTTGSGSDGGGIYTRTGDVSLTNSTISGNSASGSNSDGGGIFTDNSTVQIFNSTVSGNSASGVGGGISLSSGNFFDDDSLTLHNSIVAGNTDNGTAPDLLDVGNVANNLVIESSLISNTTGSGISTATGSGNILNQASLLGTLANNGGPTQTQALLPSSPAIDAGSNALAAALATDQRGNNRIEFGTVDIGAFESPFEVQSLVVTTNADVVDANDFETSLREAINFANTSSSPGTITFGSAFSGGDASVIRLTQGELSVSEGLTIDGTSATDLVITGDATGNDVTVAGTYITDVAASLDADSSSLIDNSRVLNFSSTVGTLTLSNLTVTGGQTTGNGGGISSYFGNIVLDNSTVSGNHGSGGFYEVITQYGTIYEDVGSAGGGIFAVSGSVTLTNSTVSGNSATGGDSYSGNNAEGGGIFTGSGNVTLTNSTVSDNSSSGSELLFGGNGGGIRTDTGNVTLTNSTVSGNFTTGSGAGVQTFSGSVSLFNSTITDNFAAFEGGGINFVANIGASLTLHNSIVAGNTGSSSAPDVLLNNIGGAGNAGNNLVVENSLVGNTTGSGITAATGTGNILNQTALLGPLADNGGLTETHALLPGSPAVDAGSNALALDDNGNPLTTDQRGEIRIQSGTVDIGAIEGAFLLGDADLNGAVDFADIPAFIDVLISRNFLNEADVDRSGVVDFADIPAFIDVLINVGSSALTFQSVVVAPPTSSAASLVSLANPVSEPVSIAPVASTVEVPLMMETSEAIPVPAELAEYDSLETTDPTEIVALPENVQVQVATESPSIEVSQLSSAESLPPVVAPQFNPSTNNLPLAPVVVSAEEYQLPERKAIGSSTPLSLVGGLAGYESPDKNRQFLASDSDSDQQENGVVDLLDETFANYEDDLDVVFS